MMAGRDRINALTGRVLPLLSLDVVHGAGARFGSSFWNDFVLKSLPIPTPRRNPLLYYDLSDHLQALIGGHLKALEG
jgi:hypothetical protein